MKQIAPVLLLAAVLFVPARSHAYVYHVCNGTPITDSNWHLYFNFDTQCTMPVGGTAWNAGYWGMYQYDNMLPNFYLNGGPGPNPCSYTSGNGYSEVGVGDPGDGLKGITIYKYDTACTYSWQQKHIIEADIIIRSSLDFAWPDESWVSDPDATCSTGDGDCPIGAGNLVFIHEMGHAIGLDHSGIPAIMNAVPPLPIGGGGGGGGGTGNAAALMPDDVAGVRYLYAQINPTQYDNIMAVDSHTSTFDDGLLTNNVRPADQFYTTSTEPAGWGASTYRCPGDSLPLWSTLVNNGVYNETFNSVLFANTCPSCTSGGYQFGWWYGMTINSAVSSSGWYQWKWNYIVPTSFPRQQTLWSFFQADSSNQVPTGYTTGAKAYDNFNHYPFVLVVGTSAQCGS